MQIRQNCVIQLGGVAYWVRDRVEVRFVAAILTQWQKADSVS